MKTHKQLVEEMLKDPAVRAEYERLEREEVPMLDTSLNARAEAGQQFIHSVTAPAR